MSEIKFNNKSRVEEPKWFSIRLGQTSKMILFYLALIGIIESTNIFLTIISLFNYIIFLGLPIEYAFREIFFIITGLISFGIFVYTIVICVKSKKGNSNNQDNINATDRIIRLFGFTLSKTAAIIIFFVALVRIPPLISSLYSDIFYLNDMVQSLLYSRADWIEIWAIISFVQIIASQISKLVLFIYSIVRFSQVRKNTERRK